MQRHINMENKNLITEIKNLMVRFGFLKEPDVVELQFIDIKLLDGTIVRCEGESIAVGSKVSVISDTGETPCPDGEYQLEDESIFTVKDGIIETIQDVTDAPEDVIPDVVAPVENEQMTELMNMLKEFITNVSTKLSEMETKNTELSSKVDEFSKLPAGLPIPDGKTITEKDITSTDARINAIVGIRNNKK